MMEFDHALGDKIIGALGIEESFWGDGHREALICGGDLSPTNNFDEPGLGWLFDGHWLQSLVFQECVTRTSLATIDDRSKLRGADASSNCCKLDSTPSHHLAARTNTARPLPQLKVQQSCNDAGRTAALDPTRKFGEPPLPKISARQ